MWLDICSLSLKNHQWRASAYTSSLPEEYLLANTTLEDAPLGRYIRRLQFGLVQDYCKVIITPTAPQSGVGCRIIGTILYQLVARCGVVGHLPTALYFQAGKSQFLPRSLLTLSYLCSAEKRRSIYDNYFYTHISVNRQEKPLDYEKRVIEVMSCQFSEYQRLDANELKLEKVQSKPDGLFLSRVRNELVIIEVKKGKRDFADGTAQIVQYYGQAMNNPEFRDLTIRTCLVTASDESTEAYKIWQELMISPKELKIVVDSSNAMAVAV